VKADELLSELSQVASELGVKVSFESLSASVGLGGLCRVKGQHRIIVDKRAGTDERIATVAESLARLHPLGLPAEIAMSTKLRQMVEQYAVPRAS